MRNRKSPLRRTLNVTLSAAVLGAIGLVAACDLLQPADDDDVQSQVSTFSKSYGGPADDTANAVAPARDGGFVLVGQAAFQRFTGTEGIQQGELWLNKLDANGNVELQRVIGSPANELPGTQTSYTRGRPTPDGGFILVGSAAILDDRDDNGIQGDGEHFNIKDIAVTKLNAEGAVEWLRTHDSGPWRNYDYFVANGAAAEARDFGEDVWPLADGGYLIAGDSKANLEDRLNLGFPPGGPEGPDRYVDAFSVVVMRLNADGSLLWTRRLADDFFHPENPHAAGPVIRDTADGGAVLARALTVDDPDVEGSSDPGVAVAAIWRLDGGGAPLWMRTTFNAGGFVIPTDLEQIDDDADGARDDGFVLTAHDVINAEILKLGADGEIQWREAVGGFQLGDVQDRASFNDIKQSCAEFGGGCQIRAVGSYEEDGDVPRGVVFSFSSVGNETERLFAPDPIAFINRISQGARGEPVALLARDAAGARYLLELHEAEPRFRNLRSLDAPVEANLATRFNPPEFTFNGGAAVFTNLALLPNIHVFDNGGALERQIVLNTAETNTDRALAVAEIASNEFVIAGSSNGFGFETGTRREVAWVLRYNLARDRIVWQRRFAVPATALADASGAVAALVATADGGVVLGGNLGLESRSPLRLLKLDGDGQVLWQSPVFADGILRELHATPDGGFIALSVNHVLAKLNSDGSLAWRRQYDHAGESSLALSDDDGDGSADDGYLLVHDALEANDVAQLLKLDSQGLPLWSRILRVGGLNLFTAHDLRLRQAPDGGYLLGATETGLLDRVDAAGNTLPLGQSNLLLVKLDGAGAAQWGRLYGGLYHEALNDLQVLDSGLILAAGHSDSLGERREAWFLKLGPNGMIREGCNALIASFVAEFFRTEPGSVAAQELLPEVNDPGPAVILADTAAPMRPPADFVTARQCLGNAGGQTPPFTPAPQRVSLSLDFSGNGSGRVSSEPPGLSCTADCQADFARGAAVTLTAAPDAGQVLAGWSGCDATDGLQCTVQLDVARLVQIAFKPDTETSQFLRVTRSGEGSGAVSSNPAGIDCGEDCAELYARDTVVTLTAAAAGGSAFAGWTGCDTVNGNQCTVTLNVERNVNASFTLAGNPVLTVNVIGDPNAGYLVQSQPPGIACGVNSGDCNESYAPGTLVHLSASHGNNFSGWQGCDQVIDQTICRVAMNSSRTVTASFQP